MPSQFPFRLLAWVPWAIAALLTVTSAWFCLRYVGSCAEIARLQGEQTLAAFETRSAHNQLQAERLIATRQLADQATIITQQAQQIEALSTQLKTGIDVARFKIAMFAASTGNSVETQAVAVWNPATGQGILQATKLPALGADQDYQLWVIDSAATVPVDGGVFSVTPARGSARVEFHLSRPVRTSTKFALSCERKGGAPKPEGPILLLNQ